MFNNSLYGIYFNAMYLFLLEKSSIILFRIDTAVITHFAITVLTNDKTFVVTQ